MRFKSLLVSLLLASTFASPTLPVPPTEALPPLTAVVPPPITVIVPPQLTAVVPPPVDEPIPVCNVCQEGISTQTSTDTIVIQPCNFEIKYDIKPFEAEVANVVQLHYFSTQVVNLQCPGNLMLDHKNDPIDFAHIAEFECVGNAMIFDLYLPILHMFGQNKTVNVNVNGHDVLLKL